MIGLSILMLAAGLILAIIVFRRGAADGVVSNRRAKWLLGGGLILLGAYGLFWLVFGIGEMLAGDLSGLIHFVPVIIIAVLMFLAIKRPLEGGIVLVGLGALGSVFTSILTGGLPFLVSGLLFLTGAVLARPGR